jgi:hypothetical protein
MSATLTDRIRDHFLAPLADVYGAYKLGLAEKLAARGVDIPLDAMRQAAEAMLRTRRAAKFPTFGECIGALDRAAQRAAPISRETITAANYGDQASAFCGGHGLKITRMHDPQAWREWQAYFLSIGYHGSAATMNGAAEWFVPAAFPHDFDPNFPALSDKAPRPRPSAAAAASPSGRPWTVFPAPPEPYAPGPNGSDPWSHVQPNGDPDWWFALPKEHPRRRSEVMNRRSADFGPMQRMPDEQPPSPTWKRPHERERDEKLAAKQRLDFPLGVEDVKLSPEAARRFVESQEVFRAEDIA